MKTLIDILKFVITIIPEVIGLVSNIDKRKKEKRKREEEKKQEPKDVE